MKDSARNLIQFPMLLMKAKFNKIRTSLNVLTQMTTLAWQAQPRIFIELIVVEIIQGSLPMVIAWVTKRNFDLLERVIGNDSTGNHFSEVSIYLIIYFLVNLIQSYAGLVHQYLSAELGRVLILRTQSTIYKEIANVEGLAYFETPEFHDVVRLAAQSGQSGPFQIINNITGFLKNITQFLTFIGVLIFLNPVIAFVIFSSSLPQLIVQLKMNRQRFDLISSNSPRERKILYLSQLLSSISYAKEVRLFNLSNYFLNKFQEMMKNLQQSQRKQQLNEIRSNVVLNFLSSLGTGGAFIIIILEAFSGGISLGDVIFYMSALGSLQGAISSIFFIVSNLHENILFFSHYTKLLDLPKSLPVIRPSKQITELKEKIELRNVSFRYSDNHPWVLRGVNLVIPKGHCLALVGLNGAGKTTLVKLLARLYDPTEGQIFWDETDIRCFDVNELREHLGAIFQDFAHYDLSIQENIGVGKITEIDNLTYISQAARTVGIEHWIKTLPQGYQTVLSRWLADDAGTDLSGGQWQKIATTRMFIRDADFFILDEPTSSLDPQAEHEIYDHFSALVKGRTTLIISHRFSSLSMADLIAVLDNGQITEYGTHEDLLKNNGTYSKLYSIQLQHLNRF